MISFYNIDDYLMQEIKADKMFAFDALNGKYCKSYCPLHPEIHKVIFASAARM